MTDDSADAEHDLAELEREIELLNEAGAEQEKRIEDLEAQLEEHNERLAVLRSCLEESMRAADNIALAINEVM